jgi:hypothetical protein
MMRRSARPLVTTLLAIAMFAAATACSATPAHHSAAPVTHTPHPTCTVTYGHRFTGPVTAPVTPATGAYVGAFASHGTATQQANIDDMNELDRQSCRPLDIAHVYLQWTKPFPSPAALAFIAQGRTLLVSWTGTDTRVMASGAVDDIIRQRAQEISALGVPVFLEFRWEMDRPNLSSVVHSPSDYIAAWDRIRSIFTAAHVNNVAWVWCPTAGGFHNGTAAAYYPGDAEVDWTCTDAYPSPIFGNAAVQPLSLLLAPFLSWARQHPKPIMIGEFGVPVRYSVAARVTWLDQAFALIASTPQIKAAVYFDAAAYGRPEEAGYGLGDRSEVAAAFCRSVVEPTFRPISPADPLSPRSALGRRRGTSASKLSSLCQ